MLLVMGTMICSNIILRNQYESIDKDNEFWEFQSENILNFKHISIKGGNKINISIIEKPNNNSILFRNKVKDLVNYYVKNDTLYIDFDERLSTLNLRKIRNKITIIVLFEKINSLITSNSSLNLKLKKTNKINIEVANYSNLMIGSGNFIIDSLKVLTKGRSFVNFDTSIVKNLDINVIENGSIDLRQIVSKKANILVDSTSSITMDSGMFNLISSKERE